MDLSSVLPFSIIYVCTKFNVHPFSAFLNMDQTEIHYENKMVKGR